MLRQLRAFAARQIQGMPRFGWKVGINVPEVQRKMGLSHSLVGFLDGERVFASDAAIHIPNGTRLHLEPELCLTLARSVDADAGVQLARAAISLVQPAFELVDYSKPTNGLDELAAHAMFHHGVILGDAQLLPS
ncbi:MAG: hypothetical protein JWN04_3473, partial [Myxococcaceae bacterium]|nr:hypothetical protein [Myxococcaceae bacterium]